MAKRRSLKLGAAAAAVAVAAMVWSGPALARDDLVIGVSQFPSNLHPDIEPEAVKDYAEGFALRSITAFDKDWKNTCRMCSELPTLQNGLVAIEPRATAEGAPAGKGIVVTVKLRSDLFWGDGVPVTTKDLAFTAKVGRDPSSGFADERVWGRVASVDVIDEHTARLHYDETFTLYDRLGSLLPEHLEQSANARAGAPGDYQKLTTYNRAPTTPGLWNGPWLLAAYTSGQQIVLEPNPYWAGRKPGFRRIVLDAVGNTAALEANLLSGDVDMAPGDAPSLTIDQVLSLRRQQPDRFNYVFRPSLSYEHVDLNLDNPILADIRVRRALIYALDRKTMTDKLFDGLQPVADSFVNPLDPMHDGEVATYPYDPVHARALLAEAGWTPGTDGVCRNTAGARLSLEFGTTAGNRLRELQQQVMQNQWKSVCIETTIRNEPARTFFGETLKQRKFTGLMLYAWISGVSSPPRQMLASSAVPTAANAYGGSNVMNFRNPAMDADIVTAERDLDPARQRAAWSDMQRIYADELPVLPLFFRADAYVLPKWLKGLEPTGHNSFSSEWAEDWRSE